MKLLLTLALLGSTALAQQPPSAPIQTVFSGMTLAPGWLPDRLGVDQKFLQGLRFYSEKVVDGDKRGQERAPALIYSNMKWLMPINEAVATLGRVSKLPEQKLINQAFPKDSFTSFGFQGQFQDGNSRFNLIFLISDAQRRLVSVQLVAQAPKVTGWDTRHPVETREPYYDFINEKRNGSGGNMVFFQVIPIQPGVKLIKTVLRKPPPFGKWLEDVHWYLPAPVAGRFLDIADKVLPKK